MSAPTLHDFKFIRDTYGIQLPDSWGIPTSKSDDVIWNIVLAYLNSFSLSDENELTRRIKCLIGNNEVNQNIAFSIEMCNPFLDRDACFSDKVLIELVDKFKNTVDEIIKNDGQVIFDKNSAYLETSSNLLSCSIVFISLKDNISTVFPTQISPEAEKNDKKQISILHRSNSIKMNGNSLRHFSFCVPKEIGLEKKKRALIEILKRTRMFDNKEETIEKISSLQDITENFLLSLLKNNFLKIIPFLLESSYVLSKLSDAGFETDPRLKDSSGKSAFLHALKAEDSQLVFLLYDHAANACSQTDVPVIGENLLCLKEYFKLLKKDLETEEISEKSRRLFRDLCRFNDFQIETCESINKIRLKYSKTKVKNHEASQRKDMLLEILKTYEKYFDIINVKAEPYVDTNDNISRFKEFYKHREYFDKLDFNLALVFFDNLFLLKEKLMLPNNAYLEVESNFFLFVFFRKYFEKYEKQKSFYSVSQFTAFEERMLLRKHLCSFKKILEETEVVKDNVVNKVSDDDVLTLTNLPKFYGEFLISRLRHYLKAATGLTVKDLKSVLTIERCFQVMGECGHGHDFNSVQKNLNLYLTKNFTKRLNDIRTSLSHIESDDELLLRNELQEDIELFKEIQNELINLKELLVPMYSIHNYELDKFMLLHLAKAVRKFLRRKTLEGCDNIPLISACSCQKLQKHFKDMYTFLCKEINDLNRENILGEEFHKENILNENVVRGFKQIVQNMISAIKKVLKSLEAQVLEKTVEELDDLFCHLETILIYITIDKKLAESHKTLKLMHEDRKSIFTELREKAKKSKNSVTPITPVLEREGGRKQLQSEPENNSKQIENFNDPFLEHGIVLESKNKKSNGFNDNGDFHNPAESVKKNRVDNEMDRENSENNIFENVNYDCMLLLTKDIMEWEEVDSFIDTPETIIHTEASSLKDNVLPPQFYQNCPVKGKIDSHTETKNGNRRYSIKDASKCLETYKVVANTVFQGFPDHSNVSHFKNIEYYCLFLEGKIFLKEEEKNLILRSVPEKFNDLSKIKQNIRDYLKKMKFSERDEKEVKFTDELCNLLSYLNLGDREITYIKEEIEKYRVIEDTLKIVEKASSYFLDLTNVLENSEKLDEIKFELLCGKLELSDDAKKLLSKLLPRQKGNKLKFLRDRIKMLKTILIDENSCLQKLWERAITPKEKIHVKEKIVQLYLTDFEIQASVETLLFHCMSISRNKKLKELWKKTTIFFKGINLRNVLAHGHPLLESLGKLLAPLDLPSELVEKMLHLISDEYVIDCMQQILEQSGTDLNGFKKIMEEDNEKFRDLSKKIRDCDGWQAYAVLIPVKSGRNV